MKPLASKKSDLTTLYRGNKHSVHQIRPTIKLPYDWQAQEIILSNGNAGFDTAYTFKKSTQNAVPVNEKDFYKFLNHCITEIRNEDKKRKDTEIATVAKNKYDEGVLAGKNEKFTPQELWFKIIMGSFCVAVIIFVSYGLYDGFLIGNYDNKNFISLRNLSVIFVLFMGFLFAALAIGHNLMALILSQFVKLAGLITGR